MRYYKNGGAVYAFEEDGSQDSLIIPGLFIAMSDEEVAMHLNPPATTPSVVSAWQIRKALNQTGLRASVEAAVAASGDHDLIDGWEFAGEFFRNDPLVVGMGAALGKTDAEMDALFVLAATL